MVISKIGADGEERIWICVSCKVDEEDICIGEKICLINDHKHQKWEIYLHGVQYAKKLDSGKDEILPPELLKTWLIKHGYKEDENMKCRH